MSTHENTVPDAIVPDAKTPQRDAADSGKRLLSPSSTSGVSPDAKKTVTEQMRARRITMPSDEASHTEWFKTLFAKFDEMFQMYDELKSSVDFYIAEVSECKKDLVSVRSDFDKMSSKMEELEYQNKQLNSEIQQLRENNLKSEIRRRELNLIFEGVRDTYGENFFLLRNKIVGVFNHMEVFNRCGTQVPIVKLQRTGPFQRDQNRPVLCQFLRYSDVRLVLDNRGQLPNNVYVQEDYPPEIEERRRILRPIFKRAKSMPQYRGKCRLTVDKLVVKGQTFTVKPVNNLDRLPPELSPRNSAERQNDDILAFFTKSSPFSNFHPAPFTKNNAPYHCNEQYIQARKAEIFNDDDSHSKIMRSKCPYEIKRLGSSIMGYQDHVWKSEAEKVTIEGCMAKFNQNPDLLKALMETNNKELAEASTDRFWGIGLALNDINVLNSSAWTGRNTLGRVLMQVREQFK